MASKQPPLPTSAKQPIEVKSLSNPDYRYILMPARENLRAKVRLNNREADGILQPLRKEMREVVAKHDFSKHLSASDCERIGGILEAQDQGLLDMTPEDIDLYQYAESILLSESDAFKKLCYHEEVIAEDQTLRQVAYMLKAVIVANGDEAIGEVKYDWPHDDMGTERFQFLKAIANDNPREIETLKLEAANLMRPSVVTEKNLEGPSGSGSGLNSSEVDPAP